MAFGDSGAHIQGLDAVPAREPAAALAHLRLLPQHGAAGVLVHRPDGLGGVAALPREAVRGPAHAQAAPLVDPAADGRLPARLGGRRGRAPALDRLRAAPHRPGALAHGDRRPRSSSRWCCSGWSTWRSSPSGSASWSRRPRSRRRSSPEARPTSPPRHRETAMDLNTIWFVARRRPHRRLRHPRRLRPGRRRAAPLRQGRGGAAGPPQGHRPGLGRQRGLAAHRRRGASSPPSRRSTPRSSAASTWR